jgi:DnaK suppressor protein
MAAKTATATATVAKKVKVLTEEDLLKAPEKDYMNEAQLAFFKQRLLELRDQLLQNADDTGEHLRENETTTDPDRATLEEYTELRTRPRGSSSEYRSRADRGRTYGYCDETGSYRHSAAAARQMTVVSAERRERVQKLYGD